jgi:hypothetical protein
MTLEDHKYHLRAAGGTVCSARWSGAELGAQVQACIDILSDPTCELRDFARY